MIGTVRSFVARTMAVHIFMRTERPYVLELLIGPPLEVHHAYEFSSIVKRVTCLFIH